MLLLLIESILPLDLFASGDGRTYYRVISGTSTAWNLWVGGVLLVAGMAAIFKSMRRGPRD